MKRTYFSKKSSLSARSALFVTLFFLRQYPTLIVMQMLFDCHERTLARVCKRTLQSLQLNFHHEQMVPSPSQLSKMKNPEDKGTFMEDIACIVDGTVIQTYRSILKYSIWKVRPLLQRSKKESRCKYVDDCRPLW